MTPPPRPMLARALALSLALAAAAHAQEAAPQGAAQASVLTRESTLTLAFDAPPGARELVLAHTLPAGAAYRPGSAELNGEALPDPAVGPSGRLYWTLPGAALGALSYGVTHAGPLGETPAPGLLARFDRARDVLLAGELDPADFARAAAPRASAAENPGPVRLPLAGSVVRDRDRVTVVVEGPLGGDLDLRVGGEGVPEDSIGKRTVDEAALTERREYVGVRLRPGPNVLASGGDRVTVHLAGPATTIEATPEALIADGSTPLRVRLRALDAYGVPAALDTLTVRPNLEVLTPDARPGEAGHQLRLEGGEGVLELRPQAVPTRLTLAVALGERTQAFAYDVAPDRSRVGVGHAALTLSAAGLRGEAQGVLETPLGEGKLYAAADTRGLPVSDSGQGPYASLGDASSQSVPLQGVDPVALRYEHPRGTLAYRQGPLPVEVLPVPGNLTALSASTRGDTRVSGFAALVPGAQVEETLTPDGTRLLHLGRAGLAPDSETVQLVAREAGSGKEASRVTLVRGADYSLDSEAGVLTLLSPLSRVDAAGNDVRLEVAYRLAAGLGERELAWGAQVRTERGAVSGGAAVVHLGGTTTAAARVAYAGAGRAASASAAVSGGVQLAADASARLGAADVQARVRYQDEAYGGLGAFAPGLNVGAGAALGLGAGVGASVDAAYQARGETSGGSVTAKLSLERGPVRASAGVQAGTGSDAGVRLFGAAGLRAGRGSLELTHAQPLGGAGTTGIGASYALTPDLRLSARDDIDWATGSRPSVGLSGKLGPANFSLGYELPTAGGDGNRARFGMDTTRAISDKLSVGLNVSDVYDVKAGTNEFSVGPSLRYQAQGLSAGLGADVAVRAGPVGASTVKTVLRGGLSVSASDRLTLGADGAAEFGATPGARLGLSGVYRSPTLSVLGTVKYQDGSLAGGQPQLTGSAQAEWHASAWGVRGGLAARTRLDDPGSLAVQGSVGATAYLTPSVGLGLVGRALWQPGAGAGQPGSVQYSAGLEGSLRVLPGTWLTVGYNPTGFAGIDAGATGRGLYARVDLLLDEQIGASR